MEQKHMSGKAALKIVVGSILAAYGLTLAVYAGFGGATLAIFWQGVANGVVPGTLQKPANKIPRTPHAPLCRIPTDSLQSETK